ncbi:MAG: FAD-dependent oxidoreductase [Caldilineaceae bacterium]
MAVQLGSTERPLRVAIVGAGPSAFYAAGALQGKAKEGGLAISIDMFEKLIAPHGLVRYGVAPDHQNIKAVSKVYERIAADSNFRYFGNVEFCNDLHLNDFQLHYDAIIFAVGAQSDRRLGIPGEDLPNSFSATEFVAWYNSHPDYASFAPNLNVESAVVVGVGNVAMDVARILAQTPEELAQSDIADHALARLKESQVKDIYVLSRRGPAQVKFTPVEIKEFDQLAIAEPIVLANEMDVDPMSLKLIEGDAEAQRNLEVLRSYSKSAPLGKERRIHFRFLISPIEIIGNEQGQIVAVKCERNKLVPTADGSDMKAAGTGEYETIPAGMVLRSVGYRGVPLSDVPYDKKSGVIPNQQGRIVDETGALLPGMYVVGWAKRGPSGVIGTNKPDSVETVSHLIEDIGSLSPAPDPNPQAVVDLLKQRGVRYVTQADWLKINSVELEAGKAQGRPRVKIVSPEEMLAVRDR